MKIDWKKEIKLPSLSGRRPKLPARKSVEARAPEVTKAPKPTKAAKLGKAPKLGKISRPKVARPSLASVSRPKPSFETPKFLADVKVPKFVADLYADLRDRRLLPLVAVLLVAIALVPILLGDKGEPEPTVQPPIVASSTAQASDTSLSVVPAESGLRDYRKRLGHREARNPFKQPAAGESAAGASAGGEAGGGGEETSEGSSGGGESTAAPESSTGSSTESTPTTPSETGSERSGEVNSGTAETPVVTSPVIVEREVTGYAIDAKTAFVGKPANTKAGIKEMTKLPNPKRPIAIYLGPSKGKKGALFLLGSEVTAYYGHGRCTLDKQACSVLELRPGKSATLAYGFGEGRYKITLKKIEPEVQTSMVHTARLGATPAPR